MRRLILVMAAFAATAFQGAAQAATTVFPASIFSNSGTQNPNNLVGDNPSTTRFNRNQSLVLNFGAATITGYGLTLNVTSVSASTTYVWARFGRIVGGVFQNANGVGLTAPNGAASANYYIQLSGPGAYFIPGAPFQTACLGIGGCNALAIGNSTFSANGAQFFASSLAATSPEPGAWALMMIGFAGVGWRLKALRRSRAKAAFA